MYIEMNSRTVAPDRKLTVSTEYIAFCHSSLKTINDSNLQNIIIFVLAYCHIFVFIHCSSKTNVKIRIPTAAQTMTFAENLLTGICAVINPEFIITICSKAHYTSSLGSTLKIFLSPNEAAKTIIHYFERGHQTKT